MYWITLAYVAVNMFAAGYFFAQKFPDAETDRDKFAVCSAILVLAFAGVLIITPVFIYDMFRRAVKWIDSFFQISFWISYSIGQYHNMTPDQLAQCNRWGVHKGTNTIRGKLFNLCVDKINQRNNYTYKEPEPNF